MTSDPDDYAMPRLDQQILRVLADGARQDTELAVLAPGLLRSTRLVRVSGALLRLGDHGWVIGYTAGPMFFYRLTDGAVRRMSAWRAER